MAGEKILLVDDEQNIIQLIRMYLEREGYRVESASDGRKALQAVREHRPALVVLDLMLPEIDGWEVCRILRAENNPVPIIMLTARDEDIDKILGLELGADDYLTKPFNPRELVARAKAIFRRLHRLSQVEDQPRHLGDLTIDPSRREVTVQGRPIELRLREYELLLTLVINKGYALSREKLLEEAWGYEYYGQTRTVDVHIGQLRKKLAGSTVRIETVTGVGYKLVG